MLTFTVDDLNINDYLKYAEDHVGETHDLVFQTASKRGEVAGTYTIIKFEASENPHFGYHYWKYEEAKIPQVAELGYYYIKFEGSKFYNGKTIKCPVSAYVQSDYDGKPVKCYKTKALFINNVNADTNKRLKAYEFEIIDFRVRA